MKSLLVPEIARYRYVHPELMSHIDGTTLENFGTFWVPSPTSAGSLNVLVSIGEGWDHVSASCKNRPPNWTEMDFIKRLFFEPDEVAMQLHVAVEDHINCHPNVLHLWRPHDQVIPLPPKNFV